MINNFYQSKAWKHKRRMILRRDGYRCQMCKRFGKWCSAVTVHHIKELEDYPELALDDHNLISVCQSCHNRLHPDKGGARR